MNQAVSAGAQDGAAPGAMDLRRALPIFLAFAAVYFFSALVRAVTATLAPVFSAELGLAAGELGLLAGAYFLGFALMQLPLGSALDRFGPRRVLLAFVSIAVLGCAAFARAGGLADLLLARLFIGVGVSACLMAPLTCFRHHFAPAAQLQANSWMLMTGALGMLASTLPVQWLLPLLGWRGLFQVVAVGMALAMLGVAWRVPRDAPTLPHAGAAGAAGAPVRGAASNGYRAVFRHAAFIRVAPLGFVAYGGMVAMQTLWIGPWLTQVAGHSAEEAARGLFLVNLAMLLVFFAWGVAMPRLTRAGWAGDRLIARSWPLSVGLLALIAWRGEQAGAVWWALWCVCTSVVSLAQPALAQQFPAALAGRALSAYNLLIFAGVFVLQWGFGLGVDGLRAAGMHPAQAHRVAVAAFALACALSFLWLQLCLRRERAATALLPAR